MAEARPFATSPSRPHYTKTTRIAADLPRCGRAGRLSFRCSREDSNPLALGSVGSRSSHLSCERMWCRHPFGQEGGVRGMRLEELRSEEHTSELQSLRRISYAVFCLKKK